MKSPAVGRAAILSKVRQRVSGRLRLGLLKPGDRIPSVRVVADELGVDPRAVLSAYQQLSDEGVVELRPRSGVFVATPRNIAAGGGALADREAEWLINQLAHAIETGIPAPDFPERARRALETRRLRAVVVDRNDDQLWSTAQELARDYGFDTTALDLDVIRSEKSLPLPLRRADIIVTASPTRAVETLAKRSQLPLISVTMCPDLFAEVRRLLLTEAVYFVVSDSRFAKKLRAFLAPTRGGSHFHVLVYGRDALRTIPKTAPLYLTRLTRHRMQNAQQSIDEPGKASDELLLLQRVLPEARVFSGQSARDLITFVVRMNQAAQRFSADGALAALGSQSEAPSGAPS